MSWLQQLHYDPLPVLENTGNAAIRYFLEKDVLETHPQKNLWNAPEVIRLMHTQQANGSWVYAGGNERIREKTHYNQLETYRNVGILVEKYDLNRTHPGIAEAAEFLFSCQTQEGDFRGIYGTQYTPNYSAAILELLVKAGYGEESRVAKGFTWLLSIRQHDGGWAIPLRTRKLNLDQNALHGPLLQPDKTRPFSHLVTGIVLRAFAAHPAFRETSEAKNAGRLLLEHLFQKDNYPDRQEPEYWYRFSFPFWWTDLLSAVDTLRLLGFTRKEPQISKALDWFYTHQSPDGLWRLKLLRAKDKDLDYWITLAICRVYKSLFPSG